MTSTTYLEVGAYEPVQILWQESTVFGVQRGKGFQKKFHSERVIVLDRKQIFFATATGDWPLFRLRKKNFGFPIAKTIF